MVDVKRKVLINVNKTLPITKIKQHIVNKRAKIEIIFVEISVSGYKRKGPFEMTKRLKNTRI